MAFKYKGKYLAYENIRPKDIGYSSDIETIYRKCVEKSEQFGIPLKDFELNTYEDYGSSCWEITFQHPATPEEIEEVDEQEAARARYKRKQYEALKKEFE